MSETKAYFTTDKAGWHVAGRRIPGEQRDGSLRPKLGHELMLTDEQAKYELLAGTIVAKALESELEAKKSARQKAD
jgi:hypothetical protein